MNAAPAAQATRLASGHLVRQLVPGDEPPLRAFLSSRWESSLFLLSNLATAGLGPGSTPQHGAWAGAFAPIAPGEAERIEAVAGHFGFGAVTLQAPDPDLLGPVARLAAALSARDVRGVGGPWGQVLRGRTALGRDADGALLAEPEVLFSLALDALVVPPALAEGRVRCRRARGDDLEALTPLRAAYLVEAALEAGSDGLQTRAREGLVHSLRQGDLFLLEEDGRTVSCSTFNARTTEAVQIGGVYTPPALRGRGHARAVVAGSLLLARAAGASRSILFTPQSNQPAQRAYRALGYQAIGDYGLILFRSPRPGP